MDVNYDYNAAFKSISVKLKKRFLRKPNVSDAIEEYSSLSKQLESEECFSLAGYCLQQVAKSYHSVGNTISESAALQSAAKQYLNSEISSTIESGSLTFNEDLVSAISIYEECIKLHCDQNERQLAAKLCLELADILAQKFDRHFESIPYYERAIGLFSPLVTTTILPNVQKMNSLQIILIQFKLAAIKIFTCDYTGALNSYTEISNLILSKCIQPLVSSPTTASSTRTSSNSMKPSTSTTVGEASANFPNTTYSKPIGIYSHFLVESDISKLLLLLFLKPTKMKHEYTNTLEVYSWFQNVSNNSNNYLPIACMDKDLFILLQSFVMAVQSNDAKILHTLQTELWPHLNEVQNHILNLITDQLLNSSYTDDLLEF